MNTIRKHERTVRYLPVSWMHVPFSENITRIQVVFKRVTNSCTNSPNKTVCVSRFVTCHHDESASSVYCIVLRRHVPEKRSNCVFRHGHTTRGGELTFSPQQRDRREKAGRKGGVFDEKTSVGIYGIGGVVLDDEDNAGTTRSQKCQSSLERTGSRCYLRNAKCCIA